MLGEKVVDPLDVASLPALRLQGAGRVFAHWPRLGWRGPCAAPGSGPHNRGTGISCKTEPRIRVLPRFSFLLLRHFQRFTSPRRASVSPFAKGVERLSAQKASVGTRVLPTRASLPTTGQPPSRPGTLYPRLRDASRVSAPQRRISGSCVAPGGLAATPHPTPLHGRVPGVPGCWRRPSTVFRSRPSRSPRGFVLESAACRTV